MNSCLYFKIIMFIENIYMCVIICGKYYNLLLFKYCVFINYTCLFKTITMDAIFFFKNHTLYTLLIKIQKYTFVFFTLLQFIIIIINNCFVFTRYHEPIQERSICLRK